MSHESLSIAEPTHESILVIIRPENIVMNIRVSFEAFTMHAYVNNPSGSLDSVFTPLLLTKQEGRGSIRWLFVLGVQRRR
jgi:hypothetical protein